MHCEEDLLHQGGNRSPQSHCNPEVPRQKGAKIEKYHDGWTNEGRAYLKRLMQEFRRVFGNIDFKTNLVDHWRTYVAKNYRTSYKRARAVEAVGEVEEYDEEDTLLDLPDENFEQMTLPCDDGAGSKE